METTKLTTDEKLQGNQARFRKHRSCVDQIASLCINIEQLLEFEWNSPLVANFIYYEKAFDSVDRETLWKHMRHHGIPDKIVKLVNATYEGTNCQGFHEGQLSEPFQMSCFKTGDAVLDKEDNAS
ncbi:uncharacterized protein LOC101857933 [Aplysia californica]|uniref:Uncharacterized protein LOC101857933 n=1 Tax=Aplysia californica TaxID=6500 RepID=A0ABM0JGF1_APLCA|nr:uncharacterized protein LOC101857933 [Aplysia californica]